MPIATPPGVPVDMTVPAFSTIPRDNSETASSTDTRFGTAEDLRRRLTELTGHPVIDSIKEAEPIGPKGLMDVLVIAPCTGNTLAKLASGVADTAVTMATKAHLRNGRPVVLAVSTNAA